MKRVVNSYAAKSVAAVSYAPEVVSRVFWWIPRIPNYAWLMMLILTASALSVSTLMNSWDQEREALSNYSYTQTRVESARGINQKIRQQTEQLKPNPRASELAAQERLRLVRHNEIVVAVK